MPVQKFSTDYSGYSIEELQDALAMISRELNYLLNGNLDDDNVRANTITAGSVFAENIDTTNAKIGAAQIDDLTVGTNVAIGTAEDSAGVTTIVGNTITSGYISALSLTVGTEIGLGTAQDSAGVTTIVGNTVTTGFVNALSITAGSVAANNISAGTITGSILQTAASGTRLVINTSGGGNIKYYDSSGTEKGSIYLDSSNLLLYGNTYVTVQGGSTASLNAPNTYMYNTSHFGGSSANVVQISSSSADYYDGNGGATQIATRGWVSGSYMPQTWITNTYESHTHGTGSTGSDTTAAHNHAFLDTDYIQCYDSGGAATVKKAWVPFAGDAHTHSIGTP